MEFANLNYLTLNGKPVRNDDHRIIPEYDELKKIKPITVNDLLEINVSDDNIALFKEYINRKLLIAPITRESPVKWKDRDQFPARMLLEITSKCNLRCVMCPRNVLKRPEMHMPKDIFFKCIDEIDDHGVSGLWLYEIGESMLHPDFREMFSYCQSKKNLGSIWLSTNGQEHENDTIDLLMNSNLTFLNYSLNAMSAESFRLISPAGNYEHSVSNFNKLLEKKKEHNRIGKTPWIRIQMIDQPQVVSEIDDFLFEYSKKTDLLSINVLEAFSQNISQNIDYAKERKRINGRHCKRIQRGDCFVFSDCEVSFCDTDFNHEMSIGNVLNSSIAKIWNGETFRRYKKLNQVDRLNEVPLCRSCLDYDL